MEETIVGQIKKLICNKNKELSDDNNVIIESLPFTFICLFETNLFNDSEYYDTKYFDENKFIDGIKTLFGECPIEEFITEANDYRKLYVYNRALKDYVKEYDGEI